MDFGRRYFTDVADLALPEILHRPPAYDRVIDLHLFVRIHFQTARRPQQCLIGTFPLLHPFPKRVELTAEKLILLEKDDLALLKLAARDLDPTGKLAVTALRDQGEIRPFDFDERHLHPGAS